MEKIISKKQSSDIVASMGVAHTEFELRSLDTMCVNESQKNAPLVV